jgi:Family of unknown function (DUF6959)
MYKAEVEIYSDTTNRAVLRHPGRKFPGVLIQGDTLSTMVLLADDVAWKAKPQLDAETFRQLNNLLEMLDSFLTHYKVVLGEHEIPLPFSDLPRWLNR